MSSTNPSNSTTNTNTNTGGWWSPLVSCCTTDTVDTRAYSSKDYPRPPPRSGGHSSSTMEKITTDNALQRLDKAVKLVLDDNTTGLLLNESNNSVTELVSAIRLLLIHGIRTSPPPSSSTTSTVSSSVGSSGSSSNIERLWDFLSTVCWTGNLRLLSNDSTSINRSLPNPVLCVSYVRSLLDNHTIPPVTDDQVSLSTTTNDSSASSSSSSSSRSMVHSLPRGPGTGLSLGTSSSTLSTGGSNASFILPPDARTTRFETAVTLFIQLCLLCKNISTVFLILSNTTESRISELRVNLYDDKAALRTPGAPERIIYTLKLLEKCTFPIELMYDSVTLPKPSWNNLITEINDNYMSNNYNSVSNLSLAGLERTIGGLFSSAAASVGLRSSAAAASVMDNRTKLPWDTNTATGNSNLPNGNASLSVMGNNYNTVSGSDNIHNNRSYATSSVGRMFNTITNTLFASASSASTRNKYAVFGRPLQQLIQDPYACMHAPLDSRLSLPDFIYDCCHILYNTELVLHLLRNNRTLSNLTPELISKYGFLASSSLNVYHSNYGRNRWMDDVLFEVNLPRTKQQSSYELSHDSSAVVPIDNDASTNGSNMNVLNFSVDTPTPDSVLGMVKGYEAVGHILSSLSTDNIETLQFSLASSSSSSDTTVSDETPTTVVDKDIAIIPTAWIEDARGALYSILYFLYRLPDPLIPQERFHTALACSYLPHWDDYSFQLERNRVNEMKNIYNANGSSGSNEDLLSLSSSSSSSTKGLSSVPYPTPLMINLRALINDLPMPNRILLTVLLTLFAKLSQTDDDPPYNDLSPHKEERFVPSSGQRSRASILAGVLGMSILRPCGDCLRAPQPPSGGMLTTPLTIVGDVRVPSYLLTPQDYTHLTLLIETMILSWRYLTEDTVNEIRQIETSVRHKTNLLQFTADAIQASLNPTGEQEHEILLRRIWKDVIPAVRASTTVDIEVANFSLNSPVWKVLGFRLVDPLPDFVSSGFLGLKCLSYLFSAHRNRSLAILARIHGNREVEAAWKALSPVEGEENIPLGSDMYYPLASTVLAIVYKLAEKLHFIQIQPVAANLTITTTNHAGSPLPNNTNMPYRRSSDPSAVPVLSSTATTGNSSGTNVPSSVSGTHPHPTTHHHHHHHVFSAATVAMHNPNLWQLCDTDKSVHSVSGVFLDLCAIATFIFDARWTAMDINENTNETNRTNLNNFANRSIGVSALSLSDIPKLVNVSVNDTLKLLPWLTMHQSILNGGSNDKPGNKSTKNSSNDATSSTKSTKSYDQPTLDVLGSIAKWRSETGVGIRSVTNNDDDRNEWIDSTAESSLMHNRIKPPSVPNEWLLPIRAPTTSNAIDEAEEMCEEGEGGNDDSMSTDPKHSLRKHNSVSDEPMSPSLIDTYALSTKPVTSLPQAYCVHKSGVLSDRQVRMLQAVLPRSLQGGSHQWQLLFSLRTDGANLDTLLNRAENRATTLLVIRDSYGAIFGAFSVNEWTRSGRYYGQPGGWVFTFEPRQREDKIRQRLLVRNEKQSRANRLQLLGESNDNLTTALIAATTNASSRNPPSPPSSPTSTGTGGTTQPFHVYRWSKTNRYFQAIELDHRNHVKGLSIGAGHYASIHLDDTLDRGFTGSCATYTCPPLARLPTNSPDVVTTIGSELKPEDIPENDLSLAHLGGDVHFRAIDVELWGFARRVAGIPHTSSFVGSVPTGAPSTTTARSSSAVRTGDSTTKNGSNSSSSSTGTGTSNMGNERSLQGRRKSLPDIKLIPSDV